jgi:SH3-like domain-containing protein
MNRLLAAFALPFIALLAAPAMAQDEDVPYWASIRTSEVNMRVGPAESYKIDWVYRREGLPMKVVRRQEGWRLVEDPDGTTGWMLARFLSRDRTAIVTGKGDAEMRDKAGSPSRLLWRIEPGVTGKLGDCEEGWCRLDVDGHSGFVREDRLWGAGEP